MLLKNLHLGAICVLVVCLAGGLAPGLSAQEEDNPFTTAMDVRTGRQLFTRQCSVCHGVRATGGDVGPDLTTGAFEHASTDAGLFSVISDGIPDTPMAGLNRNRSDQAVWQLVAYVRSLSGSGERVAVAGDATAGERLYLGMGNCSSCHRIDSEGGRHGPDLTTIGDRRSPEQLLSDLVDPDERVQPAWWTMRVTHLDGTRVEGLRMNEGTYSVRILDSDDNLWSLQKRDLRESERIETSSMPSYTGTLTAGQLEDLVAYLYGLSRPDR